MGLFHQVRQWDLEHYMKWVHTPEQGTQSRRIFDSDVLEIFTKSPWYSVLYNVPQALQLMVGLYINNWKQAIGMTLAGILLWTFIEQVVHRFVFHGTPHPKFIAMHFLFHGIHHKQPHDAMRLVMPHSVVISFQVMVVPLFWSFFKHLQMSWQSFTCLWGATLLGYIFYDLAHYSQHHVAMQTRFMPRLWTLQRKIHLQHHKSSQWSSMFGVTSPMWDLIFGTNG